MNKEILRGILVLILISTLTWSLNLNFKFVESTWLEIFGGTTLIFLLASIFIVKEKNG
jgi:hypothetical protein